MNFNEFKNYINEVLQNGRIKLFFGRDIQNFTIAINNILKFLEDKINGVDYSEDKIEELCKDCYKIINLFQNKFVLENFVSKEVRDLGKNLVILLNNFSNAIDNKSESLISRINVLNHIIYMESSIQGAIQALRILVNYARQFNGFNPPAFHVNKYYLDSIYENLKKECEE